MNYRLRDVIIASLTLAHAVSAAAAGHPMIGRYPGAEVKDERIIDYGAATIFLGQDPGAPHGWRGESVNGDLHQEVLQVDNVSSLKVFQNYREAYTKAGFEIRYQCELQACGDADLARALGDAIGEGQVYNFHRQPYYLAAVKGTGESATHVALFVGSYEDDVRVQQVIVEREPLELGLVKVDPAYIKPAAQGAKAAGIAQEGDHPMLPRYPGAKLNKTQQAEYETFKLPKVTNGAVTELSVVGDLARHHYQIDHVSTLKVYQNYRAALEKAGFAFVSECQLDSCGNREQAEELGDRLAIDRVYNYHGKPYFLLAKKDHVHVGLFVGAYEDRVEVQQVIVEEKAAQTDLITISLDDLQRQLDEEGKFAVYGVYFDTDKTVVKPESKPALDVIAQYLRQHPDVALYVVGHTDDTGSVEHNLQLSLGRARAVVAALVDSYKIDAKRLLAHGAGPFAPADHNTTDEARGNNRRVELVKRLSAR